MIGDRHQLYVSALQQSYEAARERIAELERERDAWESQYEHARDESLLIVAEEAEGRAEVEVLRAQNEFLLNRLRAIRDNAGICLPDHMRDPSQPCMHLHRAFGYEGPICQSCGEVLPEPSKEFLEQISAEVQKVRADLAVHESAYITSDGRRVDPRDVTTTTERAPEATDRDMSDAAHIEDPANHPIAEPTGPEPWNSTQPHPYHQPRVFWGTIGCWLEGCGKLRYDAIHADHQPYPSGYTSYPTPPVQEQS